MNRPVILAGEMADWPALTRWTPEYLKTRRRRSAGRIPGRAHRATSASKWTRTPTGGKRRSTCSSIGSLRPGAGNDAYLTAYNSERNVEALSGLHSDVGALDKFLDRHTASAHGMMWIGPAGTVTSLHHDLTNNFIAQVVGRKCVKLAPAADVGKLYNSRHVFSEVPDLEDPGVDLARYPRLAELRLYDVLLQPGEILFVPLGWWHQVKSLDFSVTITFTNFRWANNSYIGYPQG